MYVVLIRENCVGFDKKIKAKIQEEIATGAQQEAANRQVAYDAARGRIRTGAGTILQGGLDMIPSFGQKEEGKIPDILTGNMPAYTGNASAMTKEQSDMINYLTAGDSNKEGVAPNYLTQILSAFSAFKQ